MRHRLRFEEVNVKRIERDREGSAFCCWRLYPVVNLEGFVETMNTLSRVTAVGIRNIYFLSTSHTSHLW